MKRAAVFLALAFLFGFFAAPAARAEDYIQNDSSFIDFSSGSTTLPGTIDDEGGTLGGGSGSGTGEGSVTTNGNGEDAVSGIGTVIVGTGSGAASGQANDTGAGVGQGAASGSGQGIGTEGGEADANDILGTLTGNQAVTIRGSGDGGNPWDVSLNGEAVRRALHARGIGNIQIPGFGDFGALFGRPGARVRTGEDFAVIAASTVLKNSGIESVSLALGELHIAYRARGNLFAFIPVVYRIRIDVNPDATDSGSRVSVKFPWYKLFLQTYVSKRSLIADAEAAMSAVPEGTPGIEARARVFVLIGDAIQKRFDTVESSVASN